MKGTILGILAALLLVFGVASPGHAFSAGDLIMVVYDTTTGDEVATDLGSLASILASGGETLNANPVTLTQLGVSSFSSVNGVAYFAYNIGSPPPPTKSNPASFIAVTSTLSTVNNIVNTWAGVSSQMANVVGYYGAGSSQSQFVASTSNINSYYFDLDQNGSTGSIGSFYGWLTTANGQNGSGGEIKPLDAGSVTQNLFEWTGSTNLGVSQPGTLEGTLQTVTANGQLYAVYTPEATVPLPPSVLLLLPGLLGFIGFRKKIR